MGETPYKIKYCSVDGDPGYNNRFTEHFDLIFESLLNSDDEKAFKIIEKILGFQIGEFLHFLKNGRSKILDKKIVINPESIEDFLDFSILISDESLFNYLKDKSTLGKMRDEYAIDLFNFEICLYIYSKYSATTFIYFLIFSLWCESILNPHFSNQTRIYFLTIVYEFFKSIYFKYDHFQFNSQVKLKNGDPETYVFFLPKHKIQRIINTLIVAIFEIKYTKILVNELLSLIGIEKSENENAIIDFLKNLNEFSQKYPLKKLKIPQKLRSIGITNRYFHAESKTKKTTEETAKKEWNEEEVELIDQFLLSNRQKALFKL